MIRIFLGFVFTIGFSLSVMAAEIGDDGLHKQDWFAVTFKDLSEDMETAKDEGKRLVLMFEQRGCIYCKMVHEEVLTDSEVTDFIKEHYIVVQYNLHGDEEVIDTDGEELTEKSAARKWGVLFTPSILFLPEEMDEEKSVSEQVVAVMPGAFRKGTFLDMFRWVQQKGYAGEETFQQFHGRSIRERQAAGAENTD